MPESATLLGGAARANITPFEAGLDTQLGGYGAREGKPAEGVHDRLWAKALVLERAGHKTALISMDVCSAHASLVEEIIQRADVPGLSEDNILVAATHTHAGTEGFSMDRRNIAGNPRIGVFDEKVLDFTAERAAEALRSADSDREPLLVASGSAELQGMNANRRGEAECDPGLTVLRMDKADGGPFAAIVNWTAHGTIMDETCMRVSGGWPGVMQRTLEDMLGPGLHCLYANGAEGDVQPVHPDGGSPWEQAETYGRRVALTAARVYESLIPGPVHQFQAAARWVELPDRVPAPGFAEITGAEYGIDEAQLRGLIEHMFPATAPLFALRINDFMMVTFPGEPACHLGLELKKRLREARVPYPCVAALVSDHIGYIPTREVYNAGGYETTSSFYGPDVGEMLLEEAASLALELQTLEP